MGAYKISDTVREKHGLKFTNPIAATARKYEDYSREREYFG